MLLYTKVAALVWWKYISKYDKLYQSLDYIVYFKISQYDMVCLDFPGDESEIGFDLFSAAGSRVIC